MALVTILKKFEFYKGLHFIQWPLTRLSSISKELSFDKKYDKFSGKKKFFFPCIRHQFPSFNPHFLNKRLFDHYQKSFLLMSKANFSSLKTPSEQIIKFRNSNPFCGIFHANLENIRASNFKKFCYITNTAQRFEFIIQIKLENHQSCNIM